MFSDSGLTSTSNSNSSPSIDEDSDESSSLLTVDEFVENDLADMDYIDEPISDCSDPLDFETPTSLSDYDDDDEADSLSTELKKVTLSQVNPNENNSANDG